MSKVLMFCFLVVVLTSSCYYDNEEELYQNFPQQCDVSDVTYSIEVSDILATNCTGCHSGQSPDAGLDLTTYDNVVNAAVRIRDRINRPAGASGVMPQTGRMSQCNIDKINAWINAGAPNN